ncbi:MAG: sugar ABC transporter substrate-binding protein [Chloroflexota bacterium]
MKRNIIVVAAALAVLLMAAACSSAAPAAPTTAPASSGSAGQPSSGAAPAGQAGKKLTLGFSMPELQGSFWISMYYGVQDEAKKQGVELVALNAGGFDRLDKQIQQMQDLIQRKVDTILVGATTADGVVPVVDEAKSKGIPIVAVGSIPASKNMDSIILADHFGMGKLQGEFMAKELKGKGTVLIMAGPAGTNWAIDRANGFKEALKAYPDIKVGAEQWTPTGRANGMKLMEDWLQTFPDVAGVYTAVDDLGAGAVDALKAANKAGKVVVTSSNLSPIGEQYLREGFLQGETVQQIVLQGRVGVQQAIKAAKKESVESKVTTPVLLITKDNVDSQDYTPIQAPKDFRPSL